MTLVLPVARSQAAAMPIFGSAQSSGYSGSFGTTAASNFYTPEQAVDSWVSEKACWDYGTIRGTETCNQTCTDQLSASGCGHYTQIIWRDTRRVGCGYSTCQSGAFNFEIWVCNYDPPGNYIGEAPY